MAQLTKGFATSHSPMLLETSDLPIAEIAFECGFTHQEHLTRHFRRICQSTPAAHRRDHKHQRLHRHAALS